jgi:hypothetical protein
VCSVRCKLKLYVKFCIILKKVKVASRGFFNTPASLAGLLYSCPNKFPHSPPEAPRIIQMRETSTSEGENYPPILPVGLNFTRIPLGFFTCHKAGTWYILFYFPSERRHTEDFSDARKIQRLRPGLNPRTRVPVASMLCVILLCEGLIQTSLTLPQTFS